MPTVRPFRALRYDPDAVGSLSDVLCPPYDVISADHQRALLERHPRNAVRLELPSDPGDADPDARYRQAARTLVEWRTDGTLRKDPRPSVYVHEMRDTAPDGTERRALGAMVRLKLAPFTPGGPVRPHERTMTGPREDRFKLLRATGANLSPVVLLHERDDATSCLEQLAARQPDAEATDDAGVRHRLWACPATLRSPDDPDANGRADDPADRFLAAVEEAPLTIADGHHRYETALRYQELRGQNRACESDPPYDYVLALVYATDAAPAALATHRLVHGVGDPGDLLRRAADLFHVEAVASPERLVEVMGRAPEAADAAAPAGRRSPRFGCWTRAGGAILTARTDRLADLSDPDVPDVARRLDVSILAGALRQLAGIDRAELTGSGRVTYVREATDAVAAVERGDGDVCFLLDPTPVSAVLEVAAAGAVMPQKSTYFHPKAPTGLLFNPLEP